MTRRRAITGASAIASLLVASALVAAAILVYRPLPTIDADLRLLGLHQRGEIVRDADGVPHVYARDKHDLFYLQGYATAQDRLFQMDLYRRAGTGRLSEVFGLPTLEADRLARTFGLGRAAEADHAFVRQDTRDALDAYAAGVNKYVEGHRDALPLEFVLLGYVPEPWSAVDSLAIGKFQSFDLAVNYESELLRARVAARLGPSAIAALFPDPEGISYDDERAWERIAPYVSADVRSEGLAAWRGLFGDARDGQGSNCWAVTGERTASGRPILANDTHLPVRNPSTWYEVALDGAGYRVVGFSIPGIPGVVVGHNERIAWGLTIAYLDAQDLYVERQAPDDLRAYLFRGAAEPARVFRETIRVKGREAVAQEVVVTRHGPIVTPVLEGQTAQLALRWTALDGGRSLDAVLALDRARDWDSFRVALADFEGPALNVCYADVDGHVGVALAGAVVERASGHDGRLPVPGWTGEHEWTGVRPGSTWALLDPPGGLVVNANDRIPLVGSVGPPGPGSGATYPAAAEPDPGFRAARLKEILEPLRASRVDDHRRVQGDVVSLPARRLREALLAATPRDALAAEAQRAVREWDGTVAAGSVGAAVYEAWLVGLLERTLKDKLGEALYEDYASYGRFAVPALHALAANADSPYFTEVATGVRGRDAISSLALGDAVTRLGALRGTEPRAWTWGSVHQIRFDHPLGTLLPFLNLGPVPRGGDGYAVDNGSYRLDRPFAFRAHAALRMVVDLGDLERSGSAIPTGQSGQPFDRWWGAALRGWAAGELHPMRFSRDRLGTDGVLVVRPR